MFNYIPKDNIEEIAEGIVLDYLQDKAKDVSCIDIEGLLLDYFKLNIRYENFAEDDPNVDGYISDGVTPLQVWYNGKKIKKLYPEGTVVFDKYLLNIENSCHRRFSLAHEGGHYAAHQIYGTLLGANHTGFDMERTYTMDELRKQFSVTESQMNTMAAVFLMPRFLIEKTIKQYTNGEPIDVYGDTVFLQKDRDILKSMSDQLGVSPSALRIRLIKCGYINQRPIEELVEYMRQKGGWGNDCQ